MKMPALAVSVNDDKKAHGQSRGREWMKKNIAKKYNKGSILKEDENVITA